MLGRSQNSGADRVPSLVNAFAYWQGQKITNATATYLDDLQQAIGHIQELSGSIDGIEIWNGETGWPADGTCTHPIAFFD